MYTGETERVRAAFQRAMDIAKTSGHENTSPAHVLMAMLEDSDPLVGNLIHAAGADPKQVHSSVAKVLASYQRHKTPGAVAVFESYTTSLRERAHKHAQYHKRDVTFEDLLLAAVDTPPDRGSFGNASQALAFTGLGTFQVEMAIAKLRAGHVADTDESRLWEARYRVRRIMDSARGVDTTSTGTTVLLVGEAQTILLREILHELASIRKILARGEGEAKN